MAEEFEYIMVESGSAPILENNLLPQPVSLTTGEANYTNEQLGLLNQPQEYIKLEKESQTDDK